MTISVCVDMNQRLRGEAEKQFLPMISKMVVVSIWMLAVPWVRLLPALLEEMLQTWSQGSHCYLAVFTRASASDMRFERVAGSSSCSRSVDN